MQFKPMIQHAVKDLFLHIIILILSFIIAGFVHHLKAQNCSGYPSTWHRNLANSNYTWSLFTSGGNPRTTSMEPISWDEVRSHISYAMNEWQNAANREGNRISISNAGDNNSYANIKIYFNDQEECGNSLDLNIFLKRDGWYSNELGTGVHLRTTILHEVGHLFLGGGHWGGGVMGLDVCDSRKRESLSSCEEQIVLDFYNPPHDIYIKNDFGGGSIKVDGVMYEDIPASGKHFIWREGDAPHSIEAIDRQNFDGYVRIYKEWESNARGTMAIAPTMSFPANVERDEIYTCNTVKEFSITFQNHFTGVSGSPGQIKVEGQIRNAPYTAKIEENSPPNNVTAEGIFQIYNHIEYTFSHWEDNNTTSPRTFSVTEHATHTAYYTGKPRSMIYYNLHCSSDVGEYVTLVWDEHPNPNVTQYQIWRKVKHSQNGQIEGPTLLTTLNRGTTTWTDYEYTVTSGYTDDLLWYDVRAYYSTENTYANEAWYDVFGQQDLGPRISQFNRLDTLSSVALAKDFHLSNYPNPFHSSTRFYFQLPERSYVKLVIYDVLGRRVAILQDGYLPAGSFRKVWTGFDNNKTGLASGIYFYSFSAFSVSGSKFYRSNGKLFLSK